MTEQRTSGFRRNETLEQFLRELNADLLPAERRLLETYQANQPQQPIILVMGPLRTGTTLFMQWLANIGIAAYPTNLLSRFYLTPIIGAKIQLLLTDPRYNFRNEFSNLDCSIDYLSENGKTRGILAPNEFWYFWRRFLAKPEQDVWSDSELRSSFDSNTLLGELSGISGIYQKPFAAKAMLFNYNISYLDSIFEHVVFVQLKRDLCANVSSVLSARLRQFGTESQWYSFKIPEFDTLRSLEPVQQCAGQVYFITRAVEAGLRSVDKTRKLVVPYEQFCQNPKNTFHALCAKLGIESKYGGPARYSVHHEITSARNAEIRDALDHFIHSHGDLEPLT